MVKCQNCTHDKVCVHKTAYAMLAKKINEALPGEEILGMGESYPFSVEVNCKHYLQQQWQTLSRIQGGTSGIDPRTLVQYTSDACNQPHYK